jgi:replicative DNA helicase
MVLIAAVVVDEGARKRYLQHTPPDIFYGTGHAAIWRTLQEMDRAGLQYDPATVRQMGGQDVDVQYLEELIEQRPVAPPNLKHHVEMLRWDESRIATAKGPLTGLLELFKDPKVDPIALRGAAQQVVQSLAIGANHSLRDSKQVVDEQMRVIEERANGVATYGFGIPGLDFFGPGDYKIVDGEQIDLDGEPRLIPGTAPGNVTVVTGVSGSGKTTGTAFGVMNMVKSKRRIAYGAWEQGEGMTLELLATQSLGYSRSDMMTGNLTKENLKAVREEMEAIGQYVVFDTIPFERRKKRERHFNDRAMDRIAQSISDSKCDVYIADLFRRALHETEPDDEERALYGIQGMAKALRVHIILVQQQRLKEVESTKSKLPRRDTIKGTSAWVDIADQIIGFHRPALWKNVPDDKIWSLVMKQRYGKWPLAIEHEWEPEYGIIEGGKTIDVEHHGEEGAEGDGFW